MPKDTMQQKDQTTNLFIFAANCFLLAAHLALLWIPGV